MATQAIGRAARDRKSLDVEIVRLRGLDLGALQSRWHALFGRRAPSHLPRYLLFRLWPTACRPTCSATSIPRASGSSTASASPEKASQRAMARRAGAASPGTILAREWNGEMHRVAVLSEGFAWRRPIQASQRSPSALPAPAGTKVRGSSACATGGKGGHRHERLESTNRFAVRSIRECRPIRDLSKTSTRLMRNMMPPRPISEAKRMPVGRWSDQSMTMVASPGGNTDRPALQRLLG